MNTEQFATQESKLGFRIHKHSGVYWRELPRWYCKPVFEYQELKPGKVRPSRLRALIGYAHSVPADSPAANETVFLMTLGGDSLRDFEIASLKPRKRTAVRKAARNLEIRRISEIDSTLGPMREIAASAAQRIGRGHNARYYESRRREWESEIRLHFSLSDREWWGAYNGGRLIAYHYSYLVDGTMIISAIKSHTASLKENPNELLIFRFIEYCRDLGYCHRIIFGGWTQPESQNRFKEVFGFRKTPVSIFASNRSLINTGKAVVRVGKNLRQKYRHFRNSRR